MCMLRGTQIQQVKHSEEALWRKVDDGIINTEETVRSHNEKYSPQIRKHKEWENNTWAVPKLYGWGKLG